MIDVDNKILHCDILLEEFCCDIHKCKGICCVEGDSGAPLENDEVEKIEKILSHIFDRLTDDGRRIISEQGISMIDIEGDLTTTICDNGGACVFVQYDENNLAFCMIEKAWEEGLIDFRKPISCHLYPIRIKKYKDFDALNYNIWDICKPAICKGKEKGIKIYEFLKDPLIRKYGEEWYKDLCIAAEYLKNEIK